MIRASTLAAHPHPGPSELELAYQRACAALAQAQRSEGAWAGEVVWNPMLVCQYVICCHVVGHPIPPDRRRRILRSIELQRKPDGGWGMHPDKVPARSREPNSARPRPGPSEGLAGKYESWMFHTLLVYLALRLLGESPDAPLCRETLAWIHERGGPFNVPTWGRVWLALLGLYPWSELQPLAPELWLLPERSAMHPRRLYCHMRLIYLGLSYLYGSEAQADRSPELDALRSELYPQGWDRQRFRATRNTLAASDLYEPLGPGLRTLFDLARPLARHVPRALRRRALERAWDHIEFEFTSTDWICLSPVNGMLFCLAMWTRDRRDPRLASALAGIEYWMWEDEHEGLRIAGARSDIWDTSFVVQALAEGPSSPGLDDPPAAMGERAAAWLTRAQLVRDIPGGAARFRASARGGWGFADERHPWPVSDCTAEALEALLAVEQRMWSVPSEFDRTRKLDAIRFILLRQNDDGGFGSYEARRGSMKLRDYNPAEMYGNCMLEYSYTECTASCVRALATARHALGDVLSGSLASQVEAAIERGVAFLLDAQPDEGGWPGFWGVHYTYGTYFAVHALLAAGLDPEHPAIRRALRFLLDGQRADGGWGEHYQGVLDDEPRALDPDEPSRVTQSAWALLTLQAAAPERSSHAIGAGLRFLLDRQSESGTWPHDGSVGVFFNTAVLDYRLYKQVFPTWVLARQLGSEHCA